MSLFFTPLQRNIIKALILVILTFGITFGSFAPQAHATIPTADVAVPALLGVDQAQQASQTSSSLLDTIKEFAIDTIAFTIAQILAQKLTQKLTNWANSGFDGNPFYVDDFGALFTDIATESFETVVSEASRGDNPFIRSIVRAGESTASLVNQGTNFEGIIGGDITDINDVYDNFTVGGWATNSALYEPANNIIGTALLVEQEKDNRTAKEEEKKKTELSGSILPQSTCLSSNVELYYRNNAVVISSLDFDGQGSSFKPSDYKEGVDGRQGKFFGDSTGTEGKSFVVKCLTSSTNTPSTAIEAQLSEAVTQPLKKTNIPDEFSELIAGTFSQLVTTFIDAGLRELTSSSTTTASSFSEPASPENEFGDDWVNAPFVVIDLDKELHGVTDLTTGDVIQKGALILTANEIDIINKMLAADNPSSIPKLQELFVELDNCMPGPDGPDEDWARRLEERFRQQKAYKKAQKSTGGDTAKAEAYADAESDYESALSSLIAEVEYKKRVSTETIPHIRDMYNIVDQFSVLRNMNSRLTTERSRLSQALGTLQDIDEEFSDPNVTEATLVQLRYRFSQLKTISAPSTIAGRENELASLEAMEDQVRDLIATCRTEVAEKKITDPAWGALYDSKELLCIAPQINQAWNQNAPSGHPAWKTSEIKCNDNWYSATLGDYTRYD